MHITYPNYLHGLLPIDINVDDEFVQTILSKYPVPRLPSVSERFDLNNMNDGDTFSGLLVSVSDFKEEKTNGGKPYLSFTLGTTGGSVKAKMWDWNKMYKEGRVRRCLEYLHSNVYMEINGTVNEFPANSGLKSVIIDSVSPPPNEINALSLLPISRLDFSEMTVEFFYYLKDLKPEHAVFLSHLFEKYWHIFSTKPAARYHHHAFLGGLLQHTLGLLRIAHFLMKEEHTIEKNMFSLVDKLYAWSRKENLLEKKERISSDFSIDHLLSLVGLFHRILKDFNFDPSNAFFSIVCHDFGKVFEYMHAGDEGKYEVLFPNFEEDRSLAGKAIDMDTYGLLVGHMPYGLLMLYDVWKESSITEISVPELHKIFHNILGHHAKHEWGSSVLPERPETWFLCFCDYIDAKLEGK